VQLRHAVVAGLLSLALLALAFGGGSRPADDAAVWAESWVFFGRAGSLLRFALALDVAGAGATLGMPEEVTEALRARTGELCIAVAVMGGSFRAGAMDANGLLREMRGLREHVAKARALLAPYRSAIRDLLGEDRTRAIFGEGPDLPATSDAGS